MADKKNKKGMSLHKWVATGGNPKEFDNANHDWNTTAENKPKK